MVVVWVTFSQILSIHGDPLSKMAASGLGIIFFFFFFFFFAIYGYSANFKNLPRICSRDFMEFYGDYLCDSLSDCFDPY